MSNSAKIIVSFFIISVLLNSCSNPKNIKSCQLESVETILQNIGEQKDTIATIVNNLNARAYYAEAKRYSKNKIGIPLQIIIYLISPFLKI